MDIFFHFSSILFNYMLGFLRYFIFIFLEKIVLNLILRGHSNNMWHSGEVVTVSPNNTRGMEGFTKVSHEVFLPLKYDFLTVLERKITFFFTKSNIKLLFWKIEKITSPNDTWGRERDLKKFKYDLNGPLSVLKIFLFYNSPYSGII